MDREAELYLSLRPVFLLLLRLQYHGLSKGPERFA